MKEFFHELLSTSQRLFVQTQNGVHNKIQPPEEKTLLVVLVETIMAFEVPNEFRIRDGALGSDDSIGNNGAFLIRTNRFQFFTVASDGAGWEHVSITIRNAPRCPTWDEMCFIKSLFWNDEDMVVQFHPPKSEHVNIHKFCLHLWRSKDLVIPNPPKWMVG